MKTEAWYPARWAPQTPDIIQLYSLATPNGQKIGVCLEEMGLDYEPHLIDIGAGDQHDPDYLRLSPNGKIPTLLDPNGPEGEPMLLMESIVILQYLAEKTGRFFPATYRARMEAMQWLLFQAAHTGPMFGQFGHFHVFAKDKVKDDYAEQRYSAEARRLLGILNDRLKDREFLIGDYSIVDMAHAPWVHCLAGFYQAYDFLNMGEFEHVERWRHAVAARPAYQRGIEVCQKK